MPTPPPICDLFTPWRVGSLALAHRIVLPALPLGLALPVGLPGDAMVAFYRRRATPGGLVVCEAAAIGPGAHRPDCPGLYSAEQVNRWRQVTDAVHDAGGVVVAQLGLQGDAARPAGAAPPPLDADTLEQHLLEYRSAAENAGDAGFDAVELQASDNALPLRLLHGEGAGCAPSYREPAEARGRFLDQALGGLFGVWGRGRVGLSLAPRAGSDAPYAALLRQLDRAGLAWLHVVAPEDADPGLAADRLRPHFAGELVRTGGLDAAAAREPLQRGSAQAVAFARLFVERPDLVAELRHAQGLAG